jgi:hypothetical protein
MSTPTLASPSASDPETARRGTNASPGGALDPDGVQTGRARRRRRRTPQHDLGAAVAHEVAQQPRRVLAGGDLQGNDGEGEHQAGDRDHRC